MHLIRINHFGGKDAKILWKATGTFQYQQVQHTNTQAHMHTNTPWTGIPFQQPVCLMPINSHFRSSGERENAERWCEWESPRVHACVSSKAVTRCVWWKAPDVACLLMCNEKAQLGQKAKVADGREKRVKGRKKGIFLREIIEGWGQSVSLSSMAASRGQDEHRKFWGREGGRERQSVCWVAKRIEIGKNREGAESRTKRCRGTLR